MTHVKQTDSVLSALDDLKREAVQKKKLAAPADYNQGRKIIENLKDFEPVCCLCCAFELNHCLLLFLQVHVRMTLSF